MSIHWVLEEHDFLSSTQERAKEKASEVAQGFVVQALEQDNGSGRFGRVWSSPPGNLYLSIVLKPECAVSAAGQLSFVTSLALCHVLDEVLTKPSIQILKWPNDILLNGDKCAGILLETDISQSGNVNWVVVGVGLNISQSPPDMGAALKDHSDKHLDIANIRDRFFEKFNQYYQQWQAQGFAPIRTLWLKKSYKVGAPVSVKTGNSLVTGRFHDIDGAGNLIVLDKDAKKKVISAGEVFFNIKDI